MKNKRIEIARSTLEALDQGKYEVNGNTVSIGTLLTKGSEESKCYNPEELESLSGEIQPKQQYKTEILVKNCTTLEAAATAGGKIGVLNFASAKNPGGGFMNGAQSQEESIARSSSLYPTLDRHREMYDYNRSRRTYLYSDYMIYSPDVVVLKDDAGNFLAEPYQIDVLTSPAPNVGAILNNKPEEMTEVEAVTIKRMDKMFALFVKNQVTRLVLGAWGCGVFRNDPIKVASCFAQFLNEGGKYEGRFEQIIFAVLDQKDRGIYRAFEALRTEK